MKKFKSTLRAVRRGHIAVIINPLTGVYELYRRTRNSREHTVYIGSI